MTTKQMVELCTDIIRCKIKNWKEWLKNRADWEKSIMEAKEEEEKMLLMLLLLSSSSLMMMMMTMTTSISDTLKKVCTR